jgi:hypothetical protein
VVFFCLWRWTEQWLFLVLELPGFHMEAYTISFSCFPGLHTCTGASTSVLLDFLLVRCRSWDFWASIIRWAKFCKVLSPYLSIPISSWLFFIEEFWEKVYMRVE